MSRSTERGRHRLLTAEEAIGLERRARRHVPEDVQAALQRAVDATGEEFNPDEWSYGRSSIMGWVANRIAQSEQAHNLLVISDDCRAAWVKQGEDIEDLLAELAATDPLGRGTIEFLLSDVAPFYKGHWFLIPVEGMGWICSRRRKIGPEQRYIVSFNHRFEKSSATTPDEARPALARLLEDSDTWH